MAAFGFTLSALGEYLSWDCPLHDSNMLAVIGRIISEFVDMNLHLDLVCEPHSTLTASVDPKTRSMFMVAGCSSGTFLSVIPSATVNSAVRLKSPEYGRKRPEQRGRKGKHKKIRKWDERLETNIPVITKSTRLRNLSNPRLMVVLGSKDVNRCLLCAIGKRVFVYWVEKGALEQLEKPFVGDNSPFMVASDLWSTWQKRAGVSTDIAYTLIGPDLGGGATMDEAFCSIVRYELNPSRSCIPPKPEPVICFDFYNIDRHCVVYDEVTDFVFFVSLEPPHKRDLLSSKRSDKKSSSTESTSSAVAIVEDAEIEARKRRKQFAKSARLATDAKRRAGGGPKRIYLYVCLPPIEEPKAKKPKRKRPVTPKPSGAGRSRKQGSSSAAKKTALHSKTPTPSVAGRKKAESLIGSGMPRIVLTPSVSDGVGELEPFPDLSGEVKMEDSDNEEVKSEEVIIEDKKEDDYDFDLPPEPPKRMRSRSHESGSQTPGMRTLSTSVSRRKKTDGSSRLSTPKVMSVGRSKKKKPRRNTMDPRLLSPRGGLKSRGSARSLTGGSPRHRRGHSRSGSSLVSGMESGLAGKKYSVQPIEIPKSLRYIFDNAKCHRVFWHKVSHSVVMLVKKRDRDMVNDERMKGLVDSLRRSYDEKRTPEHKRVYGRLLIRLQLLMPDEPGGIVKLRSLSLASVKLDESQTVIVAYDPVKASVWLDTKERFIHKGRRLRVIRLNDMVYKWRKYLNVYH